MFFMRRLNNEIRKNALALNAIFHKQLVKFVPLFQAGLFFYPGRIFQQYVFNRILI